MRLLPLASASLLLFLAPALAAQPAAYPTIDSAPPVALPATFPGAPRGPQTRAEAYAIEYGVSLAEAERRARLQSAMAPEIEALNRRLRAEQAGNFAELWVEHHGPWRVVQAFRRDAEATLRRYTRNPLFEARQVGRSPEELEAALQEVTAQLDRLGVRYNRVGRDVWRTKASSTFPSTGTRLTLCSPPGGCACRASYA